MLSRSSIFCNAIFQILVFCDFCLCLSVAIELMLYLVRMHNAALALLISQHINIRQHSLAIVTMCSGNPVFSAFLKMVAVLPFLVKNSWEKYVLPE